MSLKSANWNYPTTIWFGNGRVCELENACNSLNIKKPLFVTDGGLAKFDFVKKAFSSLKNAVYYSEITANPTGENVEGGISVFEKMNCDGIIAFGGGSAIDAAKAIALGANQNIPLWQFEDVGDNWKKANSDIIPPIIAVSTTAGTGSEVGRASVITNEQTEDKKIIFHPKMMPSLVILDPQLTVLLPAHITAATGMDALTHAIEALIAPSFHPMATGIAIEACKIIFENLPKAFADGGNLEARGEMLVAASMGATAFQKGLGSVHSLAHPIGAIYHASHGLLNAIILPYAIKQNSDVITSQIAHLCNALNLKCTSVDGFLDYLLKFEEALKIPKTLAQIDIGLHRAVEIGKKAFADPSTSSNAKPLSEKDLQVLFEASVTGNMDKL